MQKHKEPSGFFANNTGANHSKVEGLMAPTSKSSSIGLFTNNFSYGLWYYSFFCNGSVPGSSRIECISHSFLSDGTFFGNYSGKILWYFHSKSHSVP